jgi:hypothetical protein
MEPKLPSPNIGPEVPSVNYAPQGERTPEESPLGVSYERGVEQLERRSEVAQPAGPPAPTLPAPVIVPIPPVTTTDSSVAAVPDDDLPVVANDDELIEKEWVDKAKKIITQTKDDPYRREQEVSKLQADYLQKRYGRELGASQ